MKSNRFAVAFCSALALLAAASLDAQNLTELKAMPGSKARVDGTGNHPWTVESQIIAGRLAIDSAFWNDPQKAAAGSKVNAQADATIPVRQIKSGKSLMDYVMHDAMHEKEHPKIEYHLKELALKAAPKSAEGPFEFDSVGDLAINGKTNSIKMPVRMERIDKSKMKTSGTTSFKMTSFGIEPPAPKLAGGFLHTDDDVKVTIEWITGTAEK